NDNIDENVKIELYKGAAFNSEITASTESDGHFEWNIPVLQAVAADYQIKITSVTDDALTNVSNNFSIVYLSSVTIIRPNGGEIFYVDSVRFIDWVSTHESDFRLDFSTDNGGSWTAIETINSTIGSSGTPWTVPNIPSDQCRVRVTDLNNGSISDVSDATFTIQAGQDNSGPALSNINFSANQPINMSSLVSVDVTDANNITAVTLFYKNGG
ncbi:MAG: hypothetical protein GY808_20275, partial [Gammaproteobacteria bacterium]|nr:hypothetical protein [Gammaproteobacteria bacterium]